MATDRTFAVQRQLVFHQLRQLLDHIIIHPVMRRPGLLGRVHIETGSGAKIIAVILAGQIYASGAGIRADNGQAQLCSEFLGAGFLHEILIGAGEARQPVQHRHLFGLSTQRRRRKKHRKFHVALQGSGGMAIAAVFPVETDVGG